MKIGLIILGSIIGFFALMIGIMVLVLNTNMKHIRNEEIREINISEYEDQTVIGSYYYQDQIGATVEVTIQEGKILDIIFIDHLYGKGGIAEVIVNDIIEEQSLLVDDISGATTSSRVIKLAVQDALGEKE